ncbi:hypothetical protein Q8F55_002049 [Vanrija albida]|uniref:Uncharacterized protein n=1 Tax=Vanrija albida TaxID=181172 RepID=A0ABR3Q8P5_9TREE
MTETPAAAAASANGNGHAPAPPHPNGALPHAKTPPPASTPLPLPLQTPPSLPLPRASASPTAARHLPSTARQLEAIAPSDSDSAGAAAMNASSSRRGLALDQPVVPPAEGSTPGTPKAQPVPPTPLRRMSIDRRVRSEALPKPRRHSSMANGTRPSVLTGGYESSSEDDKSGHVASPQSQGRTRVAALPMLQEVQAHHHLTAGASASGRRRAQSLMSPPVGQHDAGGGGGGGGGAGGAFAPPSPAGSSRRSSRLRPFATSPLSPRAPGAAAAAAGGSVTGSPRFAPTSAGSSQVPPGSANEPSVRVTAPSGGEATSSGWEDDMVRQRPRKLRAVEENRQQNQHQQQHHRPSPLTLSLGLGSLRNEAVLSSDQIQALLNDADVSSAIQLMSSTPPSRAHRQSIATPIPDASHSATATSQPSQAVDLPEVSKPYLVSAPPALTGGGPDWGGRDRDRSPSISSSAVAPSPMRNVTPATGGRRRTMSNATDSDGGHIAFTHHVPPIPAGDTDIEEASEDDIAHSDNLASAHFSANDDVSTPKTPDMSAPTPQAKDETTSRRRISGFFNLGKKRAPSPNQAPPERLERLAPPAPLPAPSPRQHQHRETQALRQKTDRESEMKNAERARRQQEQLQEQQYRARLTVNAHPAAQRKALSVSTHLDAYYSAINDGLENPPKFDPLAVLRWKRATEAQTDKRIKWESDHAADLERLRESRALSPLPWNAGASKTSLGSSPLIGSSPRYEALRPSFDTKRSRTTAPNGEPLAAPGWHYTMDDVNDYNECNGVVDYFYPPVLPPIPDPQETHTSPGPPESNASAVWSGHRSHLSVASSQDERKAKDAGVALSQRASSSVQSLIAPGNTSEDGTGALSRTNSIEATTVRPRPVSNSFRTHRAHQSTTGIPSQKSLSILRSPLESLKTAAKEARRNIAVAVADFDDSEAAPGDSTTQHTGMHHRPYNHAHHSSFRDRANMLRRNIGTSNNHGGDMSTGTSDDEHGNLRRLFGKGGVARMTSNLGPRPQKAHNADAEAAQLSRAAELRELENVYAREQRAKERQARRERQTTEMELAAAARIAQVEDEIYAERLEILEKGRKRLEQADVAATQMDYTVSHFTAQLDQVQSVFRHTADVDVSFPGLDNLRKPPTRSASRDEDETADSLGPLVAESDKGYFSAVGAGSSRPRPPRKQPAAPQVPLPSFGLGVIGPRRSVLDPITGQHVDPIGRLQLTLERGRGVKNSMVDGRNAAAEQLRDINSTIDSLVKQKESVRSWIKHLLPRIGKLKEERANIIVKLKGGVNARMWRTSDIAVDLVVRWAMGLVSYFIRILRGINWVRRVDAGWLLWCSMGAIVAMLIYFFVTGDTSPSGVPTSAAVSASVSDMPSASVSVS